LPFELLPRLGAEEYPRGVAGLGVTGLDGRGTLISLRGDPDPCGPRGAGALPRPLLGSAARGTLFGGALFDGRSMLRGAPAGLSLRDIPPEGRGTLPRDAISGAEERVSGCDIL